MYVVDVGLRFSNLYHTIDWNDSTLNEIINLNFIMDR